MKKILLFKNNCFKIPEFFAMELYKKPFPSNREGDIIKFIETYAEDYRIISNLLNLKDYIDDYKLTKYLSLNPNKIIKLDKYYIASNDIYNNYTKYAYYFNQKVCFFKIEEVDDSRPFEIKSNPSGESINYLDSIKKKAKGRQKALNEFNKFREQVIDYEISTPSGKIIRPDISSLIKIYVPNVSSKFLDVVEPIYQDLLKAIDNGIFKKEEVFEEDVQYEGERLIHFFVDSAFELFICNIEYITYEDSMLNYLCNYQHLNSSGCNNFKKVRSFIMTKLLCSRYKTIEDIFECQCKYFNVSLDYGNFAKKFYPTLNKDILDKLNVFSNNMTKRFHFQSFKLDFYEDSRNPSLKNVLYPLETTKFINEFFAVLEKTFILKSFSNKDFKINLEKVFSNYINVYDKAYSLPIVRDVINNSF